MLPITASKLLIVEGVEDDPLMKARADRLRTGIAADEVLHVDDEALNAIVATELAHTPRNGMRSDHKVIVILNRFRFDDSEEEKQRRIEQYPALNNLKYNGYGGFDWRDSGSAAHRKKTGAVCQPAWQIHTITGCHFRCSYCSLSGCLNVMMNMEDYVSRLDEWIEKCPKQTLFQWDNYTDSVCFEPESGATKLLVDYFAQQPGRALELYVGKSDNVGFLLDYDHRGHTVCCWSLSGRTQSTDIEWRSASMEARIEAMRKCQEAGYAVRVRFSPIVPVKNWEEENREAIRLLFENVKPDVITIETIRFLNYDAICRDFDLDLLDEEFVEAMKSVQGEDVEFGCQVPDAFRRKVYEAFFDEIDRWDRATPVAFCRELRRMWEHYANWFATRGQHPDRYMCNCGPYSAPATAGPLPEAAG